MPIKDTKVKISLAGLRDRPRRSTRNQTKNSPHKENHAVNNHQRDEEFHHSLHRRRGFADVDDQRMRDLLRGQCSVGPRTDGPSNISGVRYLFLPIAFLSKPGLNLPRTSREVNAEEQIALEAELEK
jgi:hypothetical protein